MKKNRITITSRKILANKKIAVLGYGSQGSAQAKNLRDSGFTPVIGLPSKSRSRIFALKDRFEILSPLKAIAKADMTAILIPDHKHKALFDSMAPSVLSGKTLVFAHGLSIHFGLVKPPPDCDVILVAPHGPGLRLREKYLTGEPFTAFVGIANKSSRKASEIAPAYAEAIGCPRRLQFESTFRNEAIGDIFGEQAVLCGGLVGLMESGFETLVRKGLSEEAAYLECIYQIDLIVDLIKEFGPAGMFERISATAAFGSLNRKDSLFGADFKKKLISLYGEIEGGKFADNLDNDSRDDMTRYKKLLSESRNSKLQKAHEDLANKLRRRSPSSGRR
ncbi:MAG: ketol-acid reductoisomerase [Candidatus Zixiibacteriota bacterium]|nr:MAG: ketol-acid reductoisomerase [candidate division Zixibacteria bacterium]